MKWVNYCSFIFYIVNERRSAQHSQVLPVTSHRVLSPFCRRQGSRARPPRAASRRGVPRGGGARCDLVNRLLNRLCCSCLLINWLLKVLLKRVRINKHTRVTIESKHSSLQQRLRRFHGCHRHLLHHSQHKQRSRRNATPGPPIQALQRQGRIERV